MIYTNLSTHSLLNNRKQYTSLFLVSMVGFAIILFASFISQGMLKSVKQKARQYYGGDIQFLGGNELGSTDADDKIEKIRPLVPEDVKFFKRFDYDAKNSSFFYEGESVRQRVIKGVDFVAEKELFSKFVFREGNAIPQEGYKIMLLSSKIADKLGVKVGDLVTVQVNTVAGYTNTDEFLVQGIFLDSSMFGMYTSYVEIDALWNITDYEKNYVNRICLYYHESPSEQDAVKLHSDLSEIFNMYPLCEDKQEFYNDFYKIPKKERDLYGLITLDANIKELHMITDAIKAICLLITVILVLIISIGIGSTYRVIVLKRTVEIGTYRALGMKPNGVRTLFVMEIVILLLAGFAAGFILSLISTGILSCFNFSFIPAFDLFLSEGHLVPSISILDTLKYMTIITVTTLVCVLFTIHKIVHLSPVKALATTN